MIFLAVLGGGFLGGVTAVKNKLFFNWTFLISAVFSAYFSLLLAPAGVQMLADLKQLPSSVISSGMVLLLFVIGMVGISKLLSVILDDTEAEELPGAINLLMNFILGFCSGMILVCIVVLCVFSAVPALLGSTPEVRMQRINALQNTAGGLLAPGNILSFTAGKGELQQNSLKKLFPVLGKTAEKKKEETAGEKSGKRVEKSLRKPEEKQTADPGTSGGDIGRNIQPEPGDGEKKKDGPDQQKQKKDKVEEDIMRILSEKE